MTTKKVCLNVWRNAHAVVTAVQGEVAGRFIEISLYDHDKPLDISEKTVAIYLVKPDKTIVYNICEILDAQNGIISVALTSQMSATAGTICDCELHVIDKQGSLLKILGLTIVVDRSLEDKNAVESSNEFTLLLHALKQSDGILETVTQTLNQTLNEYEESFQTLSQQVQTQIIDWMDVQQEAWLQKIQRIDDWLDDGDKQLQQAVASAQNSVQTAVNDANTAANRANQAVEQMEQVAGEMVDEAVSKQKNQPNGIAGLDSDGKLAQMPTPGEIGAVSVDTSINGKSLSDHITLTAQDIDAIARTERNQANGVAGLNANGTLVQMPTAADIGAVPISRTINGKELSNNITLTVNDIGISAIFLASHPVGSLFKTTVSTNPGTLYGGTWAAWGGGRTPVGVNASDTAFHTVEKTGGAKTHTLTTNEIPAHTHNIPIYWSASAGNNYAVSQGLESNNPRQYQGISNPVSSTGEGQAHNNLQPYITCYIWKRTT